MDSRLPRPLTWALPALYAVAAGDVLTQLDSIGLLRRDRELTVLETETVLRSGIEALLAGDR